jgi:hypothetical protein
MPRKYRYLHKNAANITALCMEKVPTPIMYEVTAQSRFVISPHGAGLDCHRTWETLFLNSIAIVRKSSLDVLYDDLPVLILDEWEDLTAEKLAGFYYKFADSSFDNYVKLQASYWDNQFGSHGYNRSSYDAKDLDLQLIDLLKRLNLKEGDLIKADQKAVYLIDNSTKRLIPSLDVFLTYPDWDFSNVKKITGLVTCEIDLFNIYSQC